MHGLRLPGARGEVDVPVSKCGGLGFQGPEHHAGQPPAAVVLMRPDALELGGPVVMTPERPTSDCFALLQDQQQSSRWGTEFGSWITSHFLLGATEKVPVPLGVFCGEPSKQGFGARVFECGRDDR